MSFRHSTIFTVRDYRFAQKVFGCQIDYEKIMESTKITYSLFEFVIEKDLVVK